MSDKVNCNKYMQCPGHRYRILNQSMAGQSAKAIFMNQLSMFTMVYTTLILVCECDSWVIRTTQFSQLLPQTTSA